MVKVVKSISGKRVRRAGRGYIDKFLVLFHPLSSTNINNYFNYESRCNGVFSRENLSRIKDGAYRINLDDKKSKETHWVLLFIDGNTAVYFDSFGIEYIPQEVLSKIQDKCITHSIFRIQDDGYIMCGFYCITFIEYMFAGKTLLNYTNLFSLNNYKINGKTIYKYFKDK